MRISGGRSRRRKAVRDLVVSIEGWDVRSGKVMREQIMRRKSGELMWC